MNIKEFAALKVGDKIENVATNSIATVTEINDGGLYIVWGDNAARPFYYSVQSNAWFQWVKIDKPEGDDEDPVCAV